MIHDKILIYVNEIKQVYNSEFSWKYKYDVIFALAREMREYTAISFTWTDPDVGYEEDVTAYYEALIHYLEKAE